MAVVSSADLARGVALDRAVSAITSARRAVVADRYAPRSFSVEWTKLEELEPIVEEWRELAGRALEPNVFYEPAFALEAARVFGRDVGAVLVWSGTLPRKLLGFFPARVERRRYGYKLPVLVGWTHPYAPLGTPLVEREAAEPVIAAWLAHLADHAPALLLLPYLSSEGPFAIALGAILRRAEMLTADFSRHSRAQLVPRGDRSTYVEWALGARKRKDLRRLGRRLSEAGATLFTTRREPDDVAAALDEFFALEASGWKGRAGTAAAGRKDVRRFVTAALGGLAAEDKAAVSRLYFDDRPIAAAITLRSVDTAWFWKIAYDEAFARYSPGVMLTVALTEELAEDPTLARADSCATADHPMIDHIWREQLALCDRLIALRPKAPFMLARRAESLRRAAVAGLKHIRGWFRA